MLELTPAQLLPAVTASMHCQLRRVYAFTCPAGVTSSVVETAKDALTWQDRPPTPEVQKPFQHYARQPAGEAASCQFRAGVQLMLRQSEARRLQLSCGVTNCLATPIHKELQGASATLQQQSFNNPASCQQLDRT
jgi:hypothetical protein